MEGLSPGLFLAHKDAGPDSFSVVASAKRRARPREKICHGGALDPFASGLMLVLVGPATKLFEHLHALPKTYRATIAWGTETDNLSPLGKLVATGDATKLVASAIDAALGKMLGWSEQVPPHHSNKRVGGERAWKKAQRGESFELPPSRVYLHSARVLEHRLPTETEVELVCRGGYYVRSLARDLGRALGCPAHLSRLARPAIGPWSDVSPEALVPVPRDELLGWCPTRELSDDDVGRLRRGETIPTGMLAPPVVRLPPGFPDANGPTRGVHLGKLAMLLAGEAGGLKLLTALHPAL